MVRYTLAFFRWLDHHIFMIEDYPYVGMGYTEDLDIPLPTGIQWGDIGKKFSFWFFVYFIFLFFTSKTNHVK